MSWKMGVNAKWEDDKSLNNSLLRKATQHKFFKTQSKNHKIKTKRGGRALRGTWRRVESFWNLPLAATSNLITRVAKPYVSVPEAISWPHTAKRAGRSTRCSLLLSSAFLIVQGVSLHKTLLHFNSNYETAIYFQNPLDF